MYDLNAEIKRCGHQLAAHFGITAAEFQAARKIGGRKKLRDILDWIKETRQSGEQSMYEAPEVEKSSGAQSMILVAVPADKLARVYAVLSEN